ncbi:MAG TPA: alpha/beta fold hydrolase [Caulobacteraceae bacterium]|nr:alpha/beta fold hydrolase [Caulobacteraceae bacterium]
MARSGEGPSGTRRAVLAGAAGAAAAAGSPLAAAPRSAAGFWRGEYSAAKRRGDQAIELAVYRKRLEPPGRGAPARPVLFLVHGSSTSALSSFDLPLAGGAYSSMNAFAKAGFDVWTMDHEGYGRSSRTSANSDVASGAEDLKAAAEVVLRETGQRRVSFLGESSGALRAGVFAMKHPDRIDRLGLGAFTYTGKGSPTLTERAKQLDFYRANNRRPRDRAMILSIFTRDRPGTTDAIVGPALADAELPFGDSVPTGTYLDMTTNLPVVDPLRVTCPVLLVRGEYDGIATDADLLDFYGKLPHGDKQFAVIPGAAHSLATCKNRALFEHTVAAFMTMPKPVPV